MFPSCHSLSHKASYRIFYQCVVRIIGLYSYGTFLKCSLYSLIVKIMFSNKKYYILPQTKQKKNFSLKNNLLWI